MAVPAAKLAVGILASGTGSNFDAIGDAVQSGHIPADIVLVLCNRPGAAVLATDLVLRGEAHHRTAGDTVQEPLGRRRVQGAVDDKEDVGTRRLRHLAAPVQHQRVVVALVLRALTLSSQPLGVGFALFLRDSGVGGLNFGLLVVELVMDLVEFFNELLQ